MKTKILALGLVILSLSSCKQLAYKKYAERLTISFGSSGGFSGAKEERILTGKGALYQIKSFTNDTTLLKTIGARDLKSIFKRAESKAALKAELNTPGNLTHFMSLTKSGQLVKSWKWADGVEVPKEIKELYDQLNKL